MKEKFLKYLYDQIDEGLEKVVRYANQEDCGRVIEEAENIDKVVETLKEIVAELMAP